MSGVDVPAGNAGPGDDAPPAAAPVLPPAPPARAVIFDLDGTLIDSEPIWQEADAAFLAERGITLSNAEWADVVGFGAENFLASLQETHGLAGDLGELVAEKDQAYLDVAAGRVSVVPAMAALIERLQTEGYLLAIATGSSPHVLSTMLEATRLDRRMQLSVSTREAGRGKPAPDVFLLAAEKLGVAPAECVVVEDSHHGVEAALRAGMRVIGVPARENAEKPVFGRANAVFGDGPRSIDPEVVLAVARAGYHKSDFQRHILQFFERHGRDQPWRSTSDPYAILVSEMMLQQTQADRVVPKYHAFLERFPTTAALSSAPLPAVLEMWQGLGYNRRARHLRDAATMIEGEFAGVFPRSPAELQRLPGVGPYTAAAVAAFAFGEPTVFVETNIRRVFLHFFFPNREAVHDRELMPLIEHSRYVEDPRRWYYALMDFGAHLARLFPNANRRSKHHTVQSRFAGSDRQLRGEIIRHLLAAGHSDLDAISRATESRLERVQTVLEAMQRDGLLTIDDRTVRLAT